MLGFLPSDDRFGAAKGALLPPFAITSVSKRGLANVLTN
jgi:hypothetical protein